MISGFSPVVVAVLLRPGGRPRRRPRAPAAGENAEVGPPEGRVAQGVQHLKVRRWNKSRVRRVEVQDRVKVWDLTWSDTKHGWRIPGL